MIMDRSANVTGSSCHYARLDRGLRTPDTTAATTTPGMRRSQTRAQQASRGGCGPVVGVVPVRGDPFLAGTRVPGGQGRPR